MGTLKSKISFPVYHTKLSSVHIWKTESEYSQDGVKMYTVHSGRKDYMYIYYREDHKGEFYLHILKLGCIMKQTRYRGTNIMIYYYGNNTFEVRARVAH